MSSLNNTVGLPKSTTLVSASTNVTLTSGAYDTVVLAQDTVAANATTVTLPALASVPIGTTITVIKTGGGNRVVTVQTATADGSRLYRPGADLNAAAGTSNYATAAASASARIQLVSSLNLQTVPTVNWVVTSASTILASGSA